MKIYVVLFAIALTACGNKPPPKVCAPEIGLDRRALILQCGLPDHVYAAVGEGGTHTEMLYGETVVGLTDDFVEYVL